MPGNQKQWWFPGILLLTWNNGVACKCYFKGFVENRDEKLIVLPVWIFQLQINDQVDIGGYK